MAQPSMKRSCAANTVIVAAKGVLMRKAPRSIARAAGNPKNPINPFQMCGRKLFCARLASHTSAGGSQGPEYAMTVSQAAIETAATTKITSAASTCMMTATASGKLSPPRGSR